MTGWLACLTFMLDNLTGIVTRMRAEQHATDNNLTARQMYAWAMIQRPWIACELSELIHAQAVQHLTEKGTSNPRASQVLYHMMRLASQMSVNLDASKLGCPKYVRPVTSSQADQLKAYFTRERKYATATSDSYVETFVQCYDGLARPVIHRESETPYDGFHKDDASVFNFPHTFNRLPNVFHHVNKYVRSENRARIFYVEGVACVNY